MPIRFFNRASAEGMTGKVLLSKEILGMLQFSNLKICCEVAKSTLDIPFGIASDLALVRIQVSGAKAPKDHHLRRGSEAFV